jgi:ParB family transcriptional regulator, chromosome partitioning protein
MPEEIIREIDIAAIQVSPFQPRRYFEEEEIDELASSILTIGLLHPPVVREIYSKDKFLYYELIAGERRLRACKKANMTKIPVIVRNTSDEIAAQATLIENIQRVDLDPIEMAQALKRFLNMFGVTQEEIATKIGKKRSTVANYLRLLSLPKEIQKGVSMKEISMGHAKAILSLQNKDLQHALHKMIVEKHMTVRQAEKQSARLASPSKPRVQSDEEKWFIENLSQKFQEKLGTKVTIERGSKRGGKITISFNSESDLQRLVELFAISSE